MSSPTRKGLLGSLQAFFQKLTEYFETLVLYLQKSLEVSARNLAARIFWFLVTLLCISEAIHHLGALVYAIAIQIFQDSGYSHLTTAAAFVFLASLSLWVTFRRT